MYNYKFSDVSETRKSGRAFSRAERKNCQIQFIHQESKSLKNEGEMKIFSKTTATKKPRTFVTSMPKIFNYVLQIII